MEDVASEGLLNAITSRVGRGYAVRFQRCAADRQFLAIMPKHVLKIAPAVTGQGLREVSATVYAGEPSAYIDAIYMSIYTCICVCIHICVYTYIYVSV